MKHAAALRIGLTLALLGCAPMGHSATFCVDTTTELMTALNAAGSNGEHDVVRIKTGTYAGTSANAAFFYATNQNFDITLQGGWVTLVTFDCGRQVDDPTATVLTGSGVRPALRISGNPPTSGAIVVENLTVRDGVASERGGGLWVQGGGAGFTGNVRIERVYFANNEAALFGGGASIATGGVLELRNNWFFGNRCSINFCAAEIYAEFTNATSVRSFIGNNTVVANSCSPGAGNGCDTSGFYVYGTARAAVYNNAFAFNEDNDIKLGGTSTDLVFNNINQFAGTPANMIGNLNVVDPLFVSLLGTNYRLRFDSPLRNAGTTAFETGEVDFDSAPRINDGQVDIGAYENNEVLFKSSFETLM